jgi:hypothetical protein
LVLLAVSQWISILNRMVINWVREVWEAGWVGGVGGDISDCEHTQYGGGPHQLG